MDMNIKESMMRNQVFVSTLMNKLIIVLPIFLLSMCSDAPVTPPAHACSPRLDGKPTICPTTWPDKDIKLPRKELRGEIDIYEPMHWHSINQMFIRNQRRKRIEENATTPTDAINKALMEFENGSNGSTESEELLQLSSDGNKSSS